MADSKVSALTAASALTGTELFYADDLTNDVKVTAAQIKTFAQTNVPAANITGTIGNTQLTNSSVTISGHALSLGGTLTLAAADVSLGSVTNDAQTKAAIVPNTAPSAGQILVGNAGGTAYAPVSASGDVTIASTGAHTIAAGAVSLAKMANLAANSFLGNNTGLPATPIALTAAQATAALNVFSSTLQGLVPASGGGTTNFLRADGTWAAAGGGLTNFTSDGTTLSGSGQTVTASAPVLSLTQTWNNAAVAFTGFKFNVTNTASAVASNLLDVQAGGSSVFKIGSSHNASGAGNAWDADFIQWTNSAGTMKFTQTSIWNDVVLSFSGGADNSLQINVGAIFKVLIGGNNYYQLTTSGLFIGCGSPLSLADPSGGSTNTIISNAVSNGYNLTVGNSTHATSLFVYNTTDNNTAAPTNYERGVFDWTTTANTLTIGTQAGGTGTGRAINIVAAGNIIDLSGSAGSVCRINQNTSSVVCPYNLRFVNGSLASGTPVVGLHCGTSALLEVNAASDGTAAYLLLNTTTVASLPAASATYKGARGTVSDATATTFMSTVAGGGSNVVPVFCDGTAWKIG